MPHQEGGQRGAHHVAHGDIKQRNQEHERPDHAALHESQLLGHGILPGSGLGFCPRLLRQGGPVSRLYHRVDNIPEGDGPLVIFGHHGVGQQVDRGGFYPLQLIDHLLHMSGTGGAGHTCNVELLFCHFFT